MKLDVSQNPALLQLVESTLGLTFEGVAVKTIGVLSDSSTPLGVYVYSHFTPTNCNLTVLALSNKGYSKQALAVMFGYPFQQLGLQRVTAVVHESNHQSLKGCQRLGFRQEGILRKWFGDADGYLLGMLREECKWL